MSPKEALQEILNSTPDSQLWYKAKSDNETQQTYLRVTALRISNGTARVETMDKFFSKFGYEVNVNVDVNKKSK